MDDVMDRVHVITGGAGGMGLASARRLAATGAVLLADVSQSALEIASTALNAEGIAAETVVCDVSAENDIAATVAAVGNRRLGALVHVAGLRLADSIADIFRVNVSGTRMLLDQFEAILQPGSIGICIGTLAAHTAHSVVPEIDALLQGGISDEALTALAATTEQAYPLSKRAVLKMVEQRAKRWGLKGARLLSLSPGLIATPRGLAIMDNPAIVNLLKASAIERLGYPDEIATVVEFLASESAAYITGTDILVDGGMLAAMRTARKPG
jgi:NAD(P)-dependent dehydrogenase (short-subunit alcohol dehydrogenase family)